MTNDDELLKRLDESLYFLKRTDGGHRADVAIECIEDAAARIRELKAESEIIRGGPGPIIGPADKAPPVTHVIVPVEPTEAMELAAWNAPSGGLVKGIYRAMIRAAQEGDDG